MLKKDKEFLGDRDGTPFVFGEEERTYAEEALHRSHLVRTICNVIRLISAKARNAEVDVLCMEAIYMAKRMDHTLRKYNKAWDSGLWLTDTTTPRGEVDE